MGADLGIRFDWWQSQLGTVCLGYGMDGKYVATVGGIGLSIPRQVGKTYFVMSMLVILCIIFPGLQVIWTSHHLATTNKTLAAFQGMCRRKKVKPHIQAVRTSHGEGQVRFNNGSLIMFGARSQGFGRGFDAIDVEVFDEAQILDTKALEDMIAATNQARHEHGALLFFMGTPPRPLDPSEPFELRRTKAIEGKVDNAIWLEIGAEPGSDPDDRSQWPRMNPSHPKWTPLESMLRLRENLGDEDSWNREGRGIWDPAAADAVIDAESWRLVGDEESVAVEDFALGVDVAPDRSVASIALAGVRPDGLLHVELAVQREGVGWLPAWLEEFADKNPLRAIVVDEQSPAVSLLEEFARRKVRVTLTNTKDMAAACGQFYDGVFEQSFRHVAQPQMAYSLSVARKRDLAGGWAWNRKNSTSDITPIVAATLALWGVQTKKARRPTGSKGKRKVVVYS